MRCSLIMVLCISVMQLKSQDEWTLKRDEDGIKVFTAPNGSSGFKKIKVEASFPGSIEKLKAILLDVAHNKDWVYHTRESRLVEKISDNELLYYAQTSLPWPFSNRDIVIRMRFQPDSSGKNMLVTQVGEPNITAVNNGIVRISELNATWEVKEDPANHVNITYYLNVNPAGSISSGVSNMFVTKGPFNTFSNLAQLLKSR